jgi:hypothetical protein
VYTYTTTSDYSAVIYSELGDTSPDEIVSAMSLKLGDLDEVAAKYSTIFAVIPKDWYYSFVLTGDGCAPVSLTFYPIG